MYTGIWENVPETILGFYPRGAEGSLEVLMKGAVAIVPCLLVLFVWVLCFVHGLISFKNQNQNPEKNQEKAKQQQKTPL